MGCRREDVVWSRPRSEAHQSLSSSSLRMSSHVCGRILLRAASSTLSPLSPQWPSLTQRACLSSWGCSVSGARCRSGATMRFLSTRQDLDFQLSRVQISSILRANEQAVSIPEFDGRGLSAVRKFESNQLAANTPNEDRRSAATCLQTKGMLFGVFDGHGGWACAQAVSERLLYYVAVAMMSQRGLEELEHCMEQSRPVPPILQWYKNHGDYNYRESASLYVEHLRVFWQELLDSEEHGDGMSPPDALYYAFKRLDTDISLEAQVPHSSDLIRSTAIQVAFAGSTACVAHVGTEGIHVANAGDCRAVLGVQEEDGSWSALPLSQDHNAQNEAELGRLRAQHPPSERDTVITDNRLLGILMPLRSFGDVRFKWSLELQQSVLESLESGIELDFLNLYQYTPPNYLSPPYLDVAPQLTYHSLRPQDRFLILGSDGLWDEMSSEEAVRLVGEHLSGIHLQAPVSPTERQLNLGQMQELLWKRRALAMPTLDPNAATHLIRHALGTGQYGELCQEKLASMLALPEDLARMYRDDITATVVYLNSDLVRQHR
ncbi:pyruvate dehydrogenase [acetyl-transferring]-phosphatase 2, mitochondrial isoform X2 [Oncorhynchus mykiss]|uniref:pyruvate dehydrogenase [acetyl-transferring]-phosphatase 2, mitochondrial isoform X2 n=2 Tax=Oncorhynchus mykiss TaxID=8022 RepID=UPI0018776CA0|nr:pyruvate dehydrogenase [acetyl-transferring]-phosphatase 2, mitochondrial isoform X2 [Oncorhynchus mykiss]